MVVYLLEKGTTARKAGGRLIVERKGKQVSSTPIATVERVLIGPLAQVTTQLIFALLQEKADLAFVSGKGRTAGVIETGETTLLSLFSQKRIADCAPLRLELASRLVVEKIRGQRALLLRHCKRLAGEERQAIRETSWGLRALQQKAARAGSVEELRGLEGMVARSYFPALSRLLGTGWEWHGRTRPAEDALNALLNFGYAFLEREVRLALLGAGLSVQIGFLHENNGRMDSLVYDAMEPFRPTVIDRLILKCIHRKKLRPESFQQTEEGVRLDRSARDAWIYAFEEEMGQVRQEYGGKTTREWIRAGVQEMANILRRKSDALLETEMEGDFP